MARDGDGQAIQRVMVDIETLGTKPGCVILSIGAVKFGAGGLGDEFYRSIDKESCEHAGLTVDEETLVWWLEKDENAQDALTGGDPLADVLESFAAYVDGVDEVWANSPSFDCAILEHAYDELEIDVPWEWWMERDYRTLKSLPVAPELDNDGVEHHALDDARHQAEVAIATLGRLTEVKHAAE